MITSVTAPWHRLRSVDPLTDCPTLGCAACGADADGCLDPVLVTNAARRPRLTAFCSTECVAAWALAQRPASTGPYARAAAAWLRRYRERDRPTQADLAEAARAWARLRRARQLREVAS